MIQSKILITGSLGQIGSELSSFLKKIYGDSNVITSDLIDSNLVKEEFLPYEKLDVLDKNSIANIVNKHKITVIYHLAAILSANGEKNPQLCWNININGMINILEIAREMGIKQVICPSSIAVFGPKTPKINTPQETVILPNTIYGVSKAAGELICDYYVKKFNIDIRGLRYPGLISYKAPPGGGTTDYAVEIFYYALQKNHYQCFLNANTILPMMYMEDAIRGTVELAETEFNKLSYYSNFNFAAMSFSCSELANEIKKHLPNFTIDYRPDFRQSIADSWPSSIDDSAARKQWGWQEKFNLQIMTKTMIDNLRIKLKIKQ